MGILKKLWRLLEETQQRKLLLWALLCLFSPAMDLFGVSMMIPVLQQAFDRDAAASVTGKIIFLSLLLLMTGFFELIKNRISTALVVDIAHSWSVKIYELYGMEGLEEHNRKNAAEAVGAARNDPAISAGIIISYMDLAIGVLTTAAYALAMLYFGRGVGIASCILMAALMAALYYYSRSRIEKFGEKRRRLEIRAGGLVSTMFGSYKEVRIDTQRRNLLEKYRKASAACAQVQKDYAFTQGIQGIVLRDVMQSGLFLFLAVMLAAGVDLAFVLPDVLIFITLLIRMFPACVRIVRSLTDIRFASNYFEALGESLERYLHLMQERENRMHVREKQVTLNRGIRVENLSFSYPNGKKIFENASIDIPAGAATAIIGPSGEGKTTLLDLILGLLHPSKGHIWYDDFELVEGRDEQGACRADIGAVVSYIPQIVYLNDETVRGNVTFMACEDDQDEDKIIQCLKCAQIWKDVQEMPDGLDTLIGQNGVAISGGQRQRIALARALYKQSEILIMDEATAALDMGTEQAVLDAVRQMWGRKTLLMVTHRLRLAYECDHIYKLENGQLVKVR